MFHQNLRVRPDKFNAVGGNRMICDNDMRRHKSVPDFGKAFLLWSDILKLVHQLTITKHGTIGNKRYCEMYCYMSVQPLTALKRNETNDVPLHSFSSTIPRLLHHHYLHPILLLILVHSNANGSIVELVHH